MRLLQQQQQQQQQTWNALPTGQQQALPASLKWPPMTATEDEKKGDAKVKPRMPKADGTAEDKSEKKVSIVMDIGNSGEKKDRKRRRKRKETDESDVFDLPKGVYDPNSENLLGFVDLLQMEKGKTFQVSLLLSLNNGRNDHFWPLHLNYQHEQ